MNGTFHGLSGLLMEQLIVQQSQIIMGHQAAANAQSAEYQAIKEAQDAAMLEQKRIYEKHLGFIDVEVREVKDVPLLGNGA